MNLQFKHIFDDKMSSKYLPAVSCSEYDRFTCYENLLLENARLLPLLRRSGVNLGFEMKLRALHADNSVLYS